MIYGIIEKRKNDTVKHEDMLGILIDARDDKDGLGMTSLQVRDELMTIFLAGHETTATALYGHCMKFRNTQKFNPSFSVK